ncbi:MAG: PEGA domain-containing protein [Polyangiaceae bacterium]|nr:PEGA domain-containing protein [Polyangiaceae bacterium]
MMRTVPALFVLLVSVSVPNKAAAQDAQTFAELVTAGDRARLAHRISDALKAYNQALAIRSDPAVEGRLGLVILEIGEPNVAAAYLLSAITKAQASPYLMRQFHDAFKRVRPKVCYVEVFVSEQNAEILIDGKQEPDSGKNSFHVFVVAGSHTFQAKLEGFEDGTETIDIPAGGEYKVRLELKPLPPPPPVQEEAKPNPDPKPAVVGKPPKRLSDSYTRFHVGGGAVLVLEATPGVAVGPQISGGFRRGFFSINADARVAWAVGTLDSAPDMRLVTWAAGLRPCAHYRFLFGCGLLQASGMKSLSEDDRWQTRFGGGLHAGVDLLVRAPVHLQLWGEGVVLSNSYTVGKNGNGLWVGLPVLGGFGATALLTW